MNQVADVLQTFDLGVAEFHAEFALERHDEANMAEAVPFFDIVGRGGLADVFQIVQIEDIGHRLSHLRKCVVQGHEVGSVGVLWEAVRSAARQGGVGLRLEFLIKPVKPLRTNREGSWASFLHDGRQ
jgi:hypothetical protein